MAFGLNVRRDISAVVLRKKARVEKNGRVVSRLFGIANILDGMSRETAARQAGMTRQTLRDWVVRYNADGIEGLRDKYVGPDNALTSEQEKEIETLVLEGPKGTLVRWRRVDLQQEIETRFKIKYHERTIGKILHRLGFSHMSVRALNPEADVEAQEAFKKTLQTTLKRSSLNTQKTKLSNSGSKMKQGLDKKAR